MTEKDISKLKEICERLWQDYGEEVDEVAGDLEDFIKELEKRKR